jgi:hypothetical protein
MCRLAVAILLTVGSVSFAVEVIVPRAMIEFGSGFTRNPATSGGKLVDVNAGDNNPGNWFSKGTTSLEQIHGFAHAGQLGYSQTVGNHRVIYIQIWGWLDTNGNGQADAGDTTDEWVKLSELNPQLNGGDGSGGNVVGWNIEIPDHSPIDEDYNDGVFNDILQIGNGGTAIPLAEKESWLLCVRVVETIHSATNFMDVCGTLSMWEDGDLGNDVGSNIDSDKYYDATGTRTGGPDIGIQDLHDNDFVWIYVPKS